MIKEITSLRFVFILFIFLSHIPLAVPGVSMATAFFFVLGGFGLTLGYKDKVLKPEFGYKQYLTRRLLKFYPLHWICLLAALPLALLSFSWQQVPVFFINAALLQTWVPIKSVYFSFNAVSWYLANTMFFAVVFPPLCRFVVKHRWVSALCVVVAYIMIVLLVPAEYRHYGFYINPLSRSIDFIIGIFTALAFIELREKTWVANLVRNGNLVVLVIALIIAAAVYVIHLLSTDVCMFTVIYWFPVVLVILLASLLGTVGSDNVLRSKWLVFLGDCVFTFFLVHQLVIRYYNIFAAKVIHDDNRILAAVVCLILTVAVSVFINKYILNRFTQWLTKKIQPSMTARS